MRKTTMPTSPLRRGDADDCQRHAMLVASQTAGKRNCPDTFGVHAERHDQALHQLGPAMCKTVRPLVHLRRRRGSVALDEQDRRVVNRQELADVAQRRHGVFLVEEVGCRPGAVVHWLELQGRPELHAGLRRIRVHDQLDPVVLQHVRQAGGPVAVELGQHQGRPGPGPRPGALGAADVRRNDAERRQPAAQDGGPGAVRPVCGGAWLGELVRRSLRCEEVQVARKRLGGDGLGPSRVKGDNLAACSLGHDRFERDRVHLHLAQGSSRTDGLGPGGVERMYVPEGSLGRDRLK
mmetsp:Transcript_67797/g.191125  ORF Transcript_67797/g.191125 Transcript_67797/m.191125 type:complete len:293 (-) Transcript_67797:1442-2320(-)